MSLIQIEQDRPGLWKAEVEAVTGFGTARRVMLHAPTFDEMRVKVVEAYREIVPPPAAEPAEDFGSVADAYGEPVKRSPGRPRKQQ
jgi:hypothetical protein